MNITQFTMEEVRCFGERQTLEIRPLTFLVGKNSTGKTTALACFHVLASYLRSEGLDFNADLYSMGSLRISSETAKKNKRDLNLDLLMDMLMRLLDRQLSLSKREARLNLL